MPFQKSRILQLLSDWDMLKRLLFIVGLGISYLILFYYIHHLITENRHSAYLTILLFSLFLIPDLLTATQPVFVSILFVHKKTIVAIFVSVSLFVSYLAFKKYTFLSFHLDGSNVYQEIGNTLSFFFQGIVLGLIIRMLLIDMLYKSIRAKELEVTRILMLLVYMIMLLLFPFQHKHYISFFTFGVGMGFMIHYLARKAEKRSARQARLRENIQIMLATMKEDPNYRPHEYEELAIDLYSKCKWKKLEELLNKKCPHQEIFFFIRVSMLRKQHKYRQALALLQEVQKKPNKPTWFNASEHYFHLHNALNNNEISSEKEIVISDLNKAIFKNSRCVLSNATLALFLANDIQIPAKGAELDPALNELKKQALSLIETAISTYEKSNREKMVGLVTGMTIPFTYSFLLDTYGYVLFKNEYFKFSKALFLQCLYQDASFSATYIHLAEWYLEDVKRSDSPKIREIRAAQICLYIALEYERLDDKNNLGSFITRRGKHFLNYTPQSTIDKLYANLYYGKK